MQFDPFRILDRWSATLGGDSRPFAMPMDAYRRDDGLVLHFDLPGVDPDSIDLTVERNLLTVKAQRPRPAEDDLRPVSSERPFGTFSRQLMLGEGLDLERVEAHYRDGVLTVVLPLSERAKPRRVEVGHSATARAIDASSTESTGGSPGHEA